MRVSRGEKGFTLLELLLVLLIISLTSAVVYVSVGISERKALLRDTARRIFITLRYAKEMAVMQRKVMGFVVEDDGRSYSIIQINDDERGDYQLVRKGRVRRGVVIAGMDIVFYPLGNSTGGTVTVIDNEGRRISIVVDDTTGSIEVEKS